MNQTVAGSLPLGCGAGARGKRRTAIIVLGMHRSGTSAWTRCLNLLGAELPRHVFGAGAGNETGHWEAERLVSLNNELLAACGSRWDDWRPIDFTCLSAGEYEQYIRRIKEIIVDEYSEATLLLLKDPRICRLVDVYKEALRSLGIEVKYLLPYRDPLSVIESLKQRDQMAEEFAAALWLRYVLDAIRFSDGENRAIVSYEALVSNWGSSIMHVNDCLGLSFQISDSSAKEKLEKFLSPSLQHHKSSIATLTNPSQLMRWAGAVYDALVRCEGDSRKLKNDCEISRIREDFDSVCTVMGGAIFPELSAREQKYSLQLQDKISDVDVVRRELLNSESSIAELREEISLLERWLAERNHHIDSLQIENENVKHRLSVLEGSRLIRLVRKIKEMLGVTETG